MLLHHFLYTDKAIALIFSVNIFYIAITVTFIYTRITITELSVASGLYTRLYWCFELMSSLALNT